MSEKGISNGASTGLRRGSVVTPTGSTEIRARDQMVCNSALQQIAIAYFGFIFLIQPPDKTSLGW